MIVDCQKQTVSMLCKRWDVKSDSICRYAVEGELSLWATVRNVLVQYFEYHLKFENATGAKDLLGGFQQGETTPYGAAHFKDSDMWGEFEFKLSPEDVSDLFHANNGIIEKEIFTSDATGEGYVRVTKPRQQLVTIGISDLFVHWEDVEAFEEKNMPVSPEERKLVTKVNIARYLRKYTGGNCAESSVRNWMKNKGLPHKKELNGRVTALPIELDSWWKNKMAKKKTA